MRSGLISMGFCVVALAGLTACDELGQALGMERSSVEDGPVVTNQPLTLPPDYTLKPPRETPKGEDSQSNANPAATDPDIHSQK
jgi:hypothetical protein